MIVDFRASTSEIGFTKLKDHFAANVMRDAVLAAEIYHGCSIGHTTAFESRSNVQITAVAA